MTWNFHVDDSAEGIYETIIGIYILTALALNLKFSDHIIESDDGPLEGSMLTMVDLGTCGCKNIEYSKNNT